jgi:hypothetical protein
MVVIMGCLALVCRAALALPPSAPPGSAAGEPTASRIVEENVRARGGRDAWRKIDSMAWAGRVESDELPGHSTPFMLEQQRPNHTRFEVVVRNQRSVRIYDGTSGWKLHPRGAGIPELTPFSEDELNFARDAQAIDGPLMHDVAQGAVITLVGVDNVEGRKAYALRATLPSGVVHRIWVDAETKLETRYDRDFRDRAGRSGVASVRYRDYQVFEGVKLPTTIETSSTNGAAVNKLAIEKIALNPPIDARMFSKPNVPQTRRRGVTVDTRSPPPAAGFAAAVSQ